MEEISLQNLTPDNYEEVIHLKVAEDQKHFVAPNLNSIAEAKVYPEYRPMVIYAGETIAGFLMYGPIDDRIYLIRFMIDARYQRRGYGRAALEKVVEQMRQEFPTCDRFYLSYEPENLVAERLYAAYGFVPTGEIIEGEKVACLVLENTP